jgi:cysteine desulfurase
VLAYCDYLKKVHGMDVTRLPVGPRGTLEPDLLREAIRDDTAVVSLMWANNETGVVWPIPELATICAEAGVPLHSDAVQAVGKVPVSFSVSGLSYLTMSGHKFGSPKGIGALIVLKPDCFLSFVHGGKQELGHRGGTENVAQIVGLGVAAEQAGGREATAWDRIGVLRDRFELQVQEHFRRAQINGVGSVRLPNTSNVHIPDIDGDALVTFLDQLDIYVSSGSACLESAITPSHVLIAMTGSHDIASESVRISLGLDSTSNELNSALGKIREFAELLT